MGDLAEQTLDLELLGDQLAVPLPNLALQLLHLNDRRSILTA